jgi:hypothetical protein
MDAFHNNRICRYPGPIQVTLDSGSEFKSVFQQMCDSLGIKCSPTTSYNPKGNSIIDRTHQGMGNMLRAFEPEQTELDPDDPWNEFLQSCAFGIRSTFHTTLQASPGQLVFGRDMIHDIRFQANWDRIKNNKQKNIESTNKRENLNRIRHTYNAGDRILSRKPGIRRKLLSPREGPSNILEVAVNTSGKASAQIPQLPLGDNSPPWGR